MLKHAAALKSNGTLSNASDLLRAAIVKGKLPMRTAATIGLRSIASSSVRQRVELQQEDEHIESEPLACSSTSNLSSSTPLSGPSKPLIPSVTSSSPHSPTPHAIKKQPQSSEITREKIPARRANETAAFVSQIARATSLSAALQLLDSATPAQLQDSGPVINALRDRALWSLRAPTFEPSLKGTLARTADHMTKLSQSWGTTTKLKNYAEHQVQRWKLEAMAFRGQQISPAALGRLQRQDAEDTSPKNVGRLERILKVLSSIILAQQVTDRPPRETLEHINAHWSFFNPNGQADFLPPQSLANGQARAVFLEALNVARRVPLIDVRGWMEAGPWMNKNQQQCLISLFARSHCCAGESEIALRIFNDLAEHRLHLPFSLQLEVIRALLVDGLVQEASPLLALQTKDLQARTVPQLQKALELATRAKNSIVQKRLRSILAKTVSMDEKSAPPRNSTPKSSSPQIDESGRSMTKEEERQALLRATQLIHNARKNEGQMVEVFRQTLMQGIKPDTAMCNAVLSGLARRDDLQGVQGMLQMMDIAGLKKDARTYTIAISMHARREDAVSAQRLANQAIESGVRLDGRLFHSLVMAYVSTENWEAVIRLFEDLQDDSKYATNLSSPFVLDSLLMAYVAMGVPFSTVEAFFREKLPLHGVKPATSMYIHVIRSATDAGRLRDATALLQELREKAADPVSGLVMEPRAVAIVLAGFLHTGHWREAKALYARSGMLHQPWDEVSAPIVLQAANSLPRRLRRRILRTLFPRALRSTKHADFGTEDPVEEDGRGRTMRLERLLLPIMQTQALRHKPAVVEELHQKLREAGGEPSRQSLSILLDAYRRVGDINPAKTVWEQIFLKAQEDARNNDPTDPSLLSSRVTRRHILSIPLSTYLDALVAAGAHGELTRTWDRVREAGFGYSPDNWNTFAVALIAAGRPLDAFRAIERCLIPMELSSQNPNLMLDKALANPVVGTRRSPLHRRRAAFEARRLKERQQEAWAHVSESNDVTSPLRFILQNSGYHKRWRPSAATLMALKNVIIRLRHGHMIYAKTKRWTPEVYRGSEEEAAFATLSRIQDECPLTYNKVLTSQERTHKRRDSPLRNREKRRLHTMERRVRFIKVVGETSRKQTLSNPRSRSET